MGEGMGGGGRAQVMRRNERGDGGRRACIRPKLYVLFQVCTAAISDMCTSFPYSSSCS